MKVKRIILSGGGTGGHIYPALAVYQWMKEIQPDLECLYIGTQTGLEAKIVPRAGVDFQAIKISGLKRSLSLDNIKVLWQMLNSTQRAKKIIKDFQPDVIIGTGGFVCAPVLYAGAKLNIPTLIHEQNSVAGLTNKFLSHYVTKIATSFKEVHSDFQKVTDKVVFTGNPRGQEMVNYPKEDQILQTNYGFSINKPTILIFGGSRGAPAINQAAINAIPNFENKPYQVIIGTGEVHYDGWQTYLEQNDISIPSNVRVVSYIDNMPALFNAIDLVVSRSGATTLAELTALGRASILIPSPYVTNNHQEANARSLVNNQAAVMIQEDQLTADTLTHQIEEIIFNNERLQVMSENAKALGTPNAIDDIIEIIDRMV